GRLYDPLIARFLSPDNYVQMPDNAQNFNRYTYCLNNPLKYTDPSGEFFWLITAAIGGVVNLVSNAFSGHVNSFWQGLTHFLTGAGAGLLSAYGMPMPAAGLLGTVNNITNQGFENGWSNINYQSALFDGIVSMYSARGTQYVSNTLSKPISKLTKGIANPIIRNTVTDATINAVVSGGMNTGMVLLNGGSFKDAMNSGWQGLWQGAAIGTITGTGRGIVEYSSSSPNTASQTAQIETGEYTVYQGIDPLTREIKYVGITKRKPEVRWNEHYNSGTERAKLIYRSLIHGLSRIQARIIEQQLIIQYGMQKNDGQLLNRINSIAPKYWKKYGIKN
ncbi:MAG: hypothetical protein J6I60_02460, partial [Bacteroidaceae bacterium]|nr:hypothetical protein [Bacteroidaceae bacterium]